MTAGPDTTTHEPTAGQAIRAKWVMDGATTLPEAADRLAAFAEVLRGWAEQGWTLAGPIDDDYGFLVDPQGNRGDTGEEPEDDLDPSDLPAHPGANN